MGVLPPSCLAPLLKGRSHHSLLSGLLVAPPRAHEREIS